ncbi:hypothetical protein [Absidia glauca]|uniref:Uncharacterized protein n=1 Tax=Absidia glauca TaxID=4829 RepID=A0A163LQ96_ABSGL|nr:hypothetical protein [Absidia glauca]
MRSLCYTTSQVKPEQQQWNLGSFAQVSPPETVKSWGWLQCHGHKNEGGEIWPPAAVVGQRGLGRVIGGSVLMSMAGKKSEEEAKNRIEGKKLMLLTSRAGFETTVRRKCSLGAVILVLSGYEMRLDLVASWQLLREGRCHAKKTAVMQ